MNKLIYIAILAAGFTSCKRDYENPNAPSDAQVFSSSDGLTKVMVGIKHRYAVNGIGASTVYTAISGTALTTKEVAVLNAGNADLAQILNGGNNLAPNNGTLTSLWTTSNIVNSEATKVINALNVVADVNYRNSLQVYAHLYKAMALGTMATYWTHVPVVNGSNANMVPRQQALADAIKLLDDAFTLLGTTQVPAAFNAQIGSEINLRNSLLALSARYNNMLGNHAQAIAKAAAVDLASRSIFFFNTINPNPVYRSSLVNNNTYGVVANFGLTGSLAPAANDGRIAFHLTKNATNGSGFFQGDATGIPIYQPGEMLLIQAEANARQNNPTAAKTFLDQVLTKTTDAFGVGAGLPAYSGPMTQAAILEEIYKNRAIELYMSGLKLEDSRRFGRPGPGTQNAERTRDFYPFPQQERDGNSNTPADPPV